MSYFDIKAVSNSSLNYIDPESGGNPRLFRKFLDGQLDEKPSKSFENIVEGRAVRLLPLLDTSLL